MSDTAGQPEWDDDDPIFISEEGLEFDEDGNLVAEQFDPIDMDEFRKLMLQDRIISDFIEDAMQFGGTATIIDIVNHIERRLGWKMEIIADKGAVDDSLFFQWDTFNPEAWEFFSNSDEYLELTRRVGFESILATQNFTKRITGNQSNGERVKLFITKTLKRIIEHLE